MRPSSFALPLALVSLAAAGCTPEKSPDSKGDAEAASVPLAPPPEPSFQAPRASSVTEASRRLPVRVLRTNGRAATVAITNKTAGPIARVEAWHYFYNENKECIDRGRSDCDVSVAPGATKECTLPMTDVDFLPHPFRTIEVEAFEGFDADGGLAWENENLVPSCRDRPLGGLGDTELKNRTGFRVLTTFSGEVRDRPVFYVKNVGDKTTDQIDAVVYYYANRGQLLRRYEGLPKKASIEPNHVAEVEIGFPRIELPAGTTSQELVVWHIRYEDGSEWQNANLISMKRPVGG